MPPAITEDDKACDQTTSFFRHANKPSHVVTLFKNVGYATLSLCAMILLIEGFLTLNHIGEQEYLKVDPLIGFGHLENKIVGDRSEALGIDKINSVGLTDSEHSFIKTPGVERVAVLGDSITEALQLPIKERFARRLENNLNANSRQKFEVMNFGVGGFGTGHEYLQYVRDVQKYKPDQVILVYHQGDEGENTPDGSKWSLQPTFTLSPENNPQIRYQEFDTWRKSSSAAPLTFFDWGRRNSHIWQCLLQTHSTLKNDPLYKRFTDLCSKIEAGCRKLLCSISPQFKAAQKTELRNSAESVEKARTELLQQAAIERDERSLPTQYGANSQFALTEKLIALLTAQCHRENTRLTIVFVPALEKPVSLRADFSNKIDELRKLGQSEGFDTLDLSSSFYAAEKNPTKPIILLAHLSPLGHKLVAEKIASHMLGH